MPPLWRTEAWKDSLQFLFFERGGIIFLWSFEWLNKIFLTLIDHWWFTGLKALRHKKAIHWIASFLTTYLLFSLVSIKRIDF
jgi:hypothetical protein